MQGCVWIEGSYPGPFAEDFTPYVLRDMSLEIILQSFVTRNVWSFLRSSHIVLFLPLRWRRRVANSVLQQSFTCPDVERRCIESGG